MSISNYLNALKNAKNNLINIVKPFASSLTSSNKYDELVTHVNTVMNNEVYNYRVYTGSGSSRTVVNPAGNTSFNTAVTIGPNVSSCVSMFNNCRSFNQSITIPTTIKQRDYSSMFANCRNFNRPIVFPYNRGDFSGCFYNCINFNQPINIDTGGSASYMFSHCSNFNSVVTFSNISNMDAAYMFEDCTAFNRSLNLPYMLTSCEGMFMGCTNLNQPINIPYYYSGLDFIYKGPTSMSNMFSYCTSFNQSVNIPATVSTCSYMFYRCTNLFYVPNFRTGWVNSGSDNANDCKMGVNVTNCHRMFADCYKLTTFKSGLHIPFGAKDCSYMFSGCNKLDGMDDDGDDVSLGDFEYYGICVRNMACMYSGCSNLIVSAYVPLSSTNCYHMYYGCNKITDLTIIRGAGYPTEKYNFVGIVGGRNNTYRLQIYLGQWSKVNSYFNATSSSTSITGKAISWTVNTSNKCYYNTSQNVYVYYSW